MAFQEKPDKSCRVFPYGKHGLKKSRIAKTEELINLKAAVNDGHYYVYCENCDAYMLYVSSFNDRFGMWNCPRCGVQVKEKRVYDRMEKEVRKVLNRLFGKEVSKEYHHLMKELKETSSTIRTRRGKYDYKGEV